MNDDLSYPIGKFNGNYNPTPELRREFIDAISSLPPNLTAAVQGLNDEQLDTPYRPEGWTVRQTVHHIADSHLNSFCRFKLALTEDETPTIRPYYEDRWAELADSQMPVDLSLKIIDGLHSRWASLLNSMTDADFERRFITRNPANGRWKKHWQCMPGTAATTRLI